MRQKSTIGTLIGLLLVVAAIPSARADSKAVDLAAPDAAGQWTFFNATYSGGTWAPAGAFFDKTGTIADGEMVLDGRQVISRAVYQALAWSDVTVRAKFLVEPAPAGVLACGFMFRVADADTFYYVHYDQHQAILVRSSPEKGWEEIERASNLTKPPGKWHEGEVACIGDTITVSLNGEKLYEARDSHLKAGRVGFYAGQGRVHVKDIVISGESQPASEPFAAPSPKHKAAAGGITPVSVRKLWDKAPHNAFTDLTRFRDRWYCAFREGQGHASPDGAVRVLASDDGEKWTSVAHFTDPKADLRDACLSITADGKLMVNTAAALHGAKPYRHQSVVWLSEDGEHWSEAYPVGDPNLWLWSVAWHKGTGYGIGYSTVERKFARLYKTEDGKKFETLVADLGLDQYPNESSLVFTEEDTCYCLLRRGGPGMIGMARPPYTDWTWKDLGVPIGGPEMIRLPDGRLLAAVRLYDGGARTSLCWIDPQEGKLRECLALPSGGDTSYPGMVLHDGLLWSSYYSSHEGKTNIYLAKVKVDPAE